MDKIDSLINDLKSQGLSTDALLEKLQLILREQEKNLFEKEKHLIDLMAIMDLVPNTISWINHDLTYARVNKALADSCQLTPEDFVGKKIGFHTQERFFYEFASDLFHAKETTIYRELDAKIKGVEKTFLVSGTKVSNGKMGVVIGIDITELKKLQGHISLTERLATLGELFSGIIHDINNPIMSITANLRKIAKKTNDPDILEAVAKIELSTNKVTKIVKGIKVFIYQGHEIEYASENLGKIIDDAIVILENKLKENAINLQFDFKLNEVQIECNYTQLFQVFVNLISNSIDAISSLPDKWIKINLINNAENVTVQIIDAGNGIPHEIREKIFHPFYTTKGKGIGSGLGLSLCSQIIEAHEGIIRIVEAKNTTFEIVLPKVRGK